MTAKRKLNEMQRKFAREYVECGNATEAAKRAGYSHKTANEQGARLLANVSIQKIITEHNEKAGALVNVTKAMVINRLWEKAEHAEKESDQIKALGHLVKAFGIKLNLGDADGEKLRRVIVVPDAQSVDEWNAESD